FIRQIVPPGDVRIGNIDLVNVGDGETRGGSPVSVEFRVFQGRDFRRSAQFRVSERGHAVGGSRINVIVEEITFAPFHGGDAWGIAPVTRATNHIDDARS